MANLNDSRALLVKKGLLPETAQNESNLGAAIHDLETGGKLTRRQTDAFNEIIRIVTRAVPNRRPEGVEETESVT